MASAAQRAWAKRGREQAASTPPPTTTISPSTSGGSSYRGPTAAQIKAGTLAATPATTEHRKSARTAALTQSGVRAGQTAAQAAAQATKAVYGTQSSQAKQAQATLINEQKLAASRRSVIKDLRTGVIGGVQVVQTPPSISKYLKTPHVKTPVDPHIHISTETLAGKKITDYPTVASQIATMQKNQRRAYLQLTSDASKLQTAQAQLYLAEQRLNKYPIKDGKFVGTEAQYNQYLADHAKYVKKYNAVDGAIQEYNSDINKAEIEGYKLEKLETKTRRAQYAGLAGVYEDVEAKIKESKYGPASEKQVRERIAEAEGLNPGTIGRIMDTFRSVRDQPDIHVAYPTSGTRMEPFTGLDGKVVRPPGYVVSAFGAKQAQGIEWMAMGGVQAAHEAPLKTAVSLGVGVLTPPAIKGISAVGKAAGLGAKSAVVGKAGMAGIGALYAGSVAGRTVVDIPKSITQKKYVPLALTPEEFYRAIGDIMATELIPLSVGGVIGAKAVRAAPHVKPTVKKAVTKVKELTIKEFNTQLRAVEIIQNIGMTTGKAKLLKPKIKTKPDTPAHVVKKIKKTTEQKALERWITKQEKLKGRSLLESEVRVHIRAKIERTLPKTQSEIRAQMRREAINKQISDYVHFKNQHLRIYEVGVKEQTIKQLLQSVSTGKKPKLFEAVLKQKIKTLVQIQKAKQDIKILLKNKTITRAEYNRVLKIIQKQEALISAKAKAKPVTKTKALSATSMMQQVTAVAGIMQLFKHEQLAKNKMAAAQLAKQKAKAKAVPFMRTPRKAQVSATTTLTLTAKPAAAEKAAAAKKAAKKAAAAKAKKPIKPVIPVIPGLPKRKAKKKPIHKDRQIVTYTPYQFKNRVATIASLFG